MDANNAAEDAFDAGYNAGLKAAWGEYKDSEGPSIEDSGFDEAVRHREFQNRCQEDLNGMLDVLAAEMTAEMSTFNKEAKKKARERLEYHWTEGREAAIEDFLRLRM